ncbi:2'-5' RNA ligase family protein [Nocardioides sp. zg-536]|uniref:2'-5' RNA ligase family protein n=1 Tax=Nocardioides faecalis TaxID=2803858 RepID=A0A939BSI6_9ACTN|nr:2'-5' RNA ligase family protein [Nocardioides faecalis]MBM9459669.1 2'-5' RNA ligase family protein [Nocardioides faecalis]MBS4753554.1 2'-5' RNA ligase family protein [Nocardioides faecalis]QVI58190.1 2'-5' RNA ligase family protein [Nocardioides faecalis]
MPVIGVAIAIPEPWASELYDYRQSIGDPTAAGVPSHVTLIPPLEVSGDLADIEAHLEAAGTVVSSFGVHLRGTATFRPVSPVVFVSLVEGISHVEQLADAVRRGPLAVDLDFPYHPHVTIAHHLDDPTLDRAFDDLAGFECRFEVTDFHLYVHDDEQGWVSRRTFALG